MLKATNTTSTTLLANGVIPLNLVKNTFPYVSLNNNTITISKPGKYIINGMFNIEATETITNIGLYNNGVLIPETNINITTTDGDSYELSISDLEIVVPTLPITNKVNLTIQTTSGLTDLTANVFLIELR